MISKAVRTSIHDAALSGARRMASMLGNLSPHREALRVAIIKACTVGNLVAVGVAALVIAFGVAVMTSDPIEVHAPSVGSENQAPVEKQQWSSAASSSSLATPGLETDVVGLDQAVLTPVVADSDRAVELKMAPLETAAPKAGEIPERSAQR